MSEARRGKTFSPAEDWFDGGSNHALLKLREIGDYLMELCAEELERDDHRHWWQRRKVRWQRVYDSQDASRTVSDAIHYIDPDGELRKDPDFWPKWRGERLAEEVAESSVDGEGR